MFRTVLSDRPGKLPYNNHTTGDHAVARHKHKTHRTYSKPQSYPRRRRDVTTPIAKRRLPPATRLDLIPFEDRRTNWPDRVRPAFSSPRRASQLVIGFPNANHAVNNALSRLNLYGPVRQIGSVKKPVLADRPAFAIPHRVAVCVRRWQRREVLHALGIAGGKGIGRNRKQNRNEYSEIKC